MENREYDVVGIGNAVVDVIARVEDRFLTKHDLQKGFMQLIEEDAIETLYSDMGPATERSGGSVANTIAGLASFGAKVGFIGKVGHDQFGEVFRHDITSLGVAFETPPGDIGTGMTDGIQFPKTMDFDLMPRIMSLTGVKGPEVVASLIAMLASEDGIHITGEDIRVDGGTLA